MKVLDVYNLYIKYLTVIYTYNEYNVVNSSKLLCVFHQRCMVHSLNLFLKNTLHPTDDNSDNNLDSVYYIVHSIRNIVKYFHRIPLSTQEILNIIKESNEQIFDLIMDVSTRWDSTYMMIKMSKHTDTFYKILYTQVGVKQFSNSTRQSKLNEQDWMIINNFSTLLSKFNEFTNLMS